MKHDAMIKYMTVLVNRDALYNKKINGIKYPVTFVLVYSRHPIAMPAKRYASCWI